MTTTAQTENAHIRRTESTHNAGHVRDAASLIAVGITWADTKQGADYWQEVYRNLLELAREANKGTR
jgi:hypothetical protein